MRIRNKIWFFVIVIFTLSGCNLPNQSQPPATVSPTSTITPTIAGMTFPGNTSFQADNGYSTLLFEEVTTVRPVVDEINVHELNQQELREYVQDTPPPDNRRIIISLEITPSEMMFAPPAIVKFDVSLREDLSSGDELEIYFFDEEQKEWLIIGKANVDDEGFAVGRIDHTSIYAVMENINSSSSVTDSPIPTDTASVQRETPSPTRTNTPTQTPIPTNTPTNTPTITPTSIPAPSGQIVFTSARSGTRELYTMNANGTGVTQITFVGGELDSNRADWSPNGDWLAFDSERGGSWEIYYMSSVPGSDAFNLTGSSGGFSPDWSPVADLIAFNSSRDGDWEIYVSTTDIIDGPEITKLTNNRASDSCPDWSPDGSKIAFSSDRDGNNEIYIMNADGSGVVRLTNDPATDTCPTWSPDGSQVAFISYRNGNDDIFIMNSDGTKVRQLTRGASPGNSPASWSPDGNWIAFHRNVGDWEIFIISIDGSVEIQLTDNNVYDANPAWKP